VSDLQHQRLAELSRELWLSAVPDLYSAIAQSAGAKAVLVCRLSRRNFARRA
jgi:hypothetical protein